MAAINDLISQIEDKELRERIEQELNKLSKQKKFGLVFEEHLPECVPLYDVPVKKGCKVAPKAGKVNEYYTVVQVEGDNVYCTDKKESKLINFLKQDLVCIAEFGEPIYPYLKQIDSIYKSDDTELPTHALIQADNYHALQLLEYLYAGKVDCIYIDPPYNTGAHDWKYNNDYVDSSDTYRHSKWLSMMKKRLLLAKKLLNPTDSVMIVTIDEKEYLHLGCLLEELFPETRIQMVTSVISAKGVVRNGQFSRVEEYLYIVEFGESCITPIEINMLDSEIKKEADREIEWLGFRRRAPQAIRESRPNQFYPIYVEIETGFIKKIGDVIPHGVDRHSVPEIEGCIALWPLSKDGDERLWSLTPEPARNNLKKGYLRVNNWDKESKTGTVYYLPSGTIEDIENGKAEIVGKNDDGSVIAVYKAAGTTPPKRVWNVKTHNAETYGTNLLQSVIGGRFSYPKSLYAVHDAIRFFVANKPNALIVDFFAGSGTTLHAVNLLNAEDGGKRQCIMVTNNEVSEDEAKTLSTKGLTPADEEWENLGIANYVTWPRSVCSIQGKDINGKELEDEYITINSKEIFIERNFTQINFFSEIPNFKQKKALISLINKQKDIRIPLIKEDSPYIISDDKESYNTSIIFDCSKINDYLDELQDHKEIENFFLVTQNSKEYKNIKTLVQELLGQISKTITLTKPMSEGFNSNVEFFKLGFLDKTSVQLGRQFKELLPLLWLKAGGWAKCPESEIIIKDNVLPPYIILPENHFAVLIDEKYFSEFESRVNSEKKIWTAYIVTDFEKGFKSMTKNLNVKKSYQLYRDYLDNFRINTERN